MGRNCVNPCSWCHSTPRSHAKMNHAKATYNPKWCTDWRSHVRAGSRLRQFVAVDVQEPVHPEPELWLIWNKLPGLFQRLRDPSLCWILALDSACLDAILRLSGSQGQNSRALSKACSLLRICRLCTCANYCTNSCAHNCWLWHMLDLSLAGQPPPCWHTGRPFLACASTTRLQPHLWAEQGCESDIKHSHDPFWSSKQHGDGAVCSTISRFS